jgi:hypothetical protein
MNYDPFVEIELVNPEYKDLPFEKTVKYFGINRTSFLKFFLI